VIVGRAGRATRQTGALARQVTIAAARGARNTGATAIAGILFGQLIAGAGLQIAAQLTAGFVLLYTPLVAFRNAHCIRTRVGGLHAGSDRTIHTNTPSALTRSDTHIGRTAAFTIGLFNRNAPALGFAALLRCAFILIVITGAQGRPTPDTLALAIAVVIGRAVETVIARALVRGVLLNAAALRVVAHLESARIACIWTSDRVARLADPSLTDRSRRTNIPIVTGNAVLHGLEATCAVGTNTGLACGRWAVLIGRTWARVIARARPIFSARIFFSALISIVTGLALIDRLCRTGPLNTDGLIARVTGVVVGVLRTRLWIPSAHTAIARVIDSTSVPVVASRAVVHAHVDTGVVVCADRLHARIGCSRARLIRRTGAGIRSATGTCSITHIICSAVISIITGAALDRIKITFARIIAGPDVARVVGDTIAVVSLA